VGLHTNPTCVLDFASLYPSIMRFWNLRRVLLLLIVPRSISALTHSFLCCSYDTFLRSDAEAALNGLTPDQYYTSPNGFKFVKKGVHEGILPMIETELLAARKRAKRQMKEAANAMDRSVFDGKQYVSNRNQGAPLYSLLTARVCFAQVGFESQYCGQGGRVPSFCY